MDDLFGDERIQFFLRNRADIKTWAAIEADVIAATRELLARAQPGIEERLLTFDPNVLVGRRDAGQWERILARRERWPETVGLALEWHRSVDLLGRARPKLGVFWWADPPALIEPRTRFEQAVDRAPLQRLGFKIPLEGSWPARMLIAAAPDWWRDPEAWIAGIVDLFAATWPLVVSDIDDALADDWQAGIDVGRPAEPILGSDISDA